jgi:hypothetical protein
VEKNRSLNSTVSSSGIITDVRGDRRPSQTAEPVNFGREPVLALRGQIDLSTKPPSTDIHIAFDSTLELGGTWISPGDSKDLDSIEEHAIS